MEISLRLYLTLFKVQLKDQLKVQSKDQLEYQHAVLDVEELDDEAIDGEDLDGEELDCDEQVDGHL